MLSHVLYMHNSRARGPDRGRQPLPNMLELRFAPMLLCALLAASAAGVEAQVVAGFRSPVQTADLLYFSGHPRQAFDLLDEHLERRPEDYEALWRAARSAVMLGIAAEGSRAQNAWLDPGIELAERAVALRPDGLDGLYWRGAAVGRRAMNAAPGYAAELAQKVYEDANRILELDGTHAGAHNLLGKLNYEVMSISRVERAIGRLFMGNDILREASWESAELHLMAAVASEPELIRFQFDLAQLHRKRGREEEARKALLEVISLPSVHPTDLEVQAQAREILEDLQD